MDRAEEIRSEMRVLRDELDEIESAEKAKEAEEYLGKFFKYRNCYSCPEKESDYWYVYAHVIGITTGGSLISHMFQVDKHGRCEAEQEYRHVKAYSSWTNIPEAEYREAEKRFLAKIGDYVGK